MTESQRPTPIVVTHEGGAQFTAAVRSHRVTVDQPAGAGGADAGPMPLELLGASLGTCIAVYVQQFLHVRGLPYQGMRVEVEQHTARGPYRIAEFAVRVVLSTPLPPGFVEMLERVARSCPVHNTLQQLTPVQVNVETAAAVLA